MKIPASLALSLLLGFPLGAAVSPLQSEAVSVESSVSAVELFPGSARVQRRFIAETKDTRPVTFRIPGLSRQIDAGGIAVAPVEAEGVRIGSVSYDLDRDAVEENPEVKRLRAAVETIDQTLRGLETLQQNAAERVKYFNSIAQSVRDALKTEPGAEVFDLSQNAWRNYEQIRQESEQEVVTRDSELKTLREERQKLAQDLAKAETKAQQSSGFILVEVSTATPGAVTIQTEYTVHRAFWRPVYELRANPADKEITLIYRAQLQQSSGEDWLDARIHLSTSQPTAGSRPPELHPLPLGPDVPRIASNMKARAMASYDLAAEAAPAPPATEFSATTTGFNAALPLPVTLISGAPAISEILHEQTMPATFWSEATPLLSLDAFLMGSGTNLMDWPLLEGEARFHVDGRLAAIGQVPTTLPGETFTFGFGRNANIHTERHERVRRASQTGLIDRSQRHERRYETVVTNHMPTAHRIVLKDRVPVSQHNRLQVRITQPRGASPEEGTGFLSWEGEVPAGQSETFVLEYDVTYPSDWQIPLNF